VAQSAQNHFDESPFVADAPKKSAAPPPIVTTLRRTLDAARANVQIRERLKTMVSDPARFDSLVREVGPSHALVRDLIAITRHGEPEVEREDDDSEAT
jgi:hypothetical protein